MSGRLAGACALVLLLGSTGPAGAVTLASAGRTSHRVVLASGAIPAERTAAEELVHYLERVTGASFELVAEERLRDEAPAIWIGPTSMARRLGIDARSMGPEEWRTLTEGEELVLVGGRPRGTLYAVYRFLEDQIGVRWWTPYEEYVPSRPELEVGVDARGEPAFAYRDIHGVSGPAVFHARNRANGHYSFLTSAHGGNEGYGPPFMVHTFFQYLPPEDYFEAHPEFYAERDGRRVGERTQLCLTNEELVPLVVEKLRGFIEQSREEAARKGERPPRLFDLSQNDWARPCTCELCSAIDRREGGHAGSLVRFLNRVAAAIADEYPELLLDTLAYQYTLDPPRRTHLADNVVVRLADLFERDYSKPVTHRANRSVRRAIEGWRERTEHLRIWGYTVTFGRRANNLPLPNLNVIAEDFRYYAAQGIEGLFLQHDHPVLADLRDLKLWVVFKLAEEPTRDLDELVREFTDGFYGPAGATVREYLGELERAAASKRHAIRYPVNYEQYRYLTPRFLRRAHSLFDRAAELAGSDEILRKRLRYARLSLDRATLLRWEPSLARAPRRGDAGSALDAEAIAARYRRSAEEQIELRVRPGRRPEFRERLDDEITKLLARIENGATLSR